MRFGSNQFSKFFDSRFIAIVSITLICVLLVQNYLNYTSIVALQIEKDDLTQKYDEINIEYSNLLADHTQLKKNVSNFQSQLSDLKTQYDASIDDQKNMLLQIGQLQSQYTELQSQQNDLIANQDQLESDYSGLLTNYTQLLVECESLRPVADFSYLIFSDGEGKYYAENGSTRTVDYFGESGSQVTQNCLDTLSTSGGKIVFLGKISLDTPLIIRDENTDGLLELSGIGPSTQLLVGQDNDGIHILGDQAYGYSGPFHIVIRDLVLTSEYLPKGKCMNNGIYIKNWFGVDIQNVMVFFANNAGILIENSADVQLDNIYVEGCGGTEYGGDTPLTGVGFWLRGSKDCYLSHCYSDTNYIGFLIDSNPNTYNMPRNVFLSQCEATLCNQRGIVISNADGVSVSDSLVEGSNSDGIMIIDSFRINLVNVLIVGNVGNGIIVTSQTVNMNQGEIRIVECTINGNNKNGIGILATNGYQISLISIESCTIINSGTGARNNPDQLDQWNGINISDDATKGGNCRFIRIFGCFVGNRIGAYQTQNYGIQSLQNSDNIQVFHNYFFNNTAGNYSLAGVNNSFENNITE